jgi:hypothetical protein
VQHSNVNLYFTPTYSSWLNQVESWFSKLQRDVIDRGIFTSVADLKRKILRYIRLYQKPLNPFSGNTRMSANGFPRGSDVSGTAREEARALASLFFATPT